MRIGKIRLFSLRRGLHINQIVSVIFLTDKLSAYTVKEETFENKCSVLRWFFGLFRTLLLLLQVYSRSNRFFLPKRSQKERLRLHPEELQRRMMPSWCMPLTRWIQTFWWRWRSSHECTFLYQPAKTDGEFLRIFARSSLELIWCISLAETDSLRGVPRKETSFLLRGSKSNKKQLKKKRRTTHAKQAKLNDPKKYVKENAFCTLWGNNEFVAYHSNKNIVVLYVDGYKNHRQPLQQQKTGMSLGES